VTYSPRTLDQRLDVLLRGLPALVIDGPKAVGKTATASRRATTVLNLDDLVERTLVQADRDRILRLPGPVLIDEWQLDPPVWDRVRRAVDAGAAPGSFLLTGSAAPTSAPMHTGAGRIVRVRMRPMSVAERGLVAPTVSLAGLLAGDLPTVEGVSPVTLSDYADEIVTGGLPGLRLLDPEVRPVALRGYVDAIVEREFPEVGHVVRRPSALRVLQHDPRRLDSGAERQAREDHDDRVPRRARTAVAAGRGAGMDRDALGGRRAGQGAEASPGRSGARGAVARRERGRAADHGAP
jgi:predicted AAA+ superfamily ATPase